MDTKPVTEVFPLDEGNESITQRRGWIKINIIGPLAKACWVEGGFPRHFVLGYDRCCLYGTRSELRFPTVPGAS
jgi:hypothetical protein